MKRSPALSDSAKKALAHLAERLGQGWTGSIRIEAQDGGVRDLVEVDQRAQVRPLEPKEKAG
jgi:hypothetical protein